MKNLEPLKRGQVLGSATLSASLHHLLYIQIEIWAMIFMLPIAADNCWISEIHVLLFILLLTLCLHQWPLCCVLNCPVAVLSMYTQQRPWKQTTKNNR